VSNLITQANFARLHKVSRKAVTTWKQRGYLVFSGQLVDVEKSNASLAGVGRAWPETVTRVATEVATVRTPEVRAADTQAPYVAHPLGLVSEVISTMAVIIDGIAIDGSELLLRHLPRETVAPILDEMIARARRGAVEILYEHSIDPPDEFESWADHRWFSTPPMSEADWEESAELAVASVQAGGAAPDA
jgi:hypothetical protein